jgi:predicted nucleotidyltransferase
MHPMEMRLKKQESALDNNLVLELLKECVAEIQKVAGDSLRKIILFGSFARADYDTESDIDIMVLLDADEERIREIDTMIDTRSYELSLKYGRMLSILLKSSAHFYKYNDVLPFYSNVQNQGVVLYG